jgi:hypothetical protein
MCNLSMKTTFICFFRCHHVISSGDFGSFSNRSFFLSSRIDEICQPSSSSSGFGKSSWDNDLTANQKGKSSAANSSAKWNDDFEKEKYGLLVNVPDPFWFPIPGSG